MTFLGHSQVCDSIPTFTFNKIEDSSVPKTYAFVVGISEYPHSPALENLEAPVRDALLVKEYLSNWENIEIQLRTNENAKHRDGLLLDIDNAINKAKSGDQIIFYFAGHGDIIASGQNKAGVLFLNDATVSDYNGVRTFSPGVLRVKELVALAENASEKGIEFITIIDACKSGHLESEIDEIKNEDIRDLRVYMLSSSKDQESFENPNLKHGLFTYYLLEGLAGNADDDNNYRIDEYEYSTYVEGKLRNELNIQFDSDKKQIPKFRAYDDFDLHRYDEFKFQPIADTIESYPYLVSRGMSRIYAEPGFKELFERYKYYVDNQIIFPEQSASLPTTYLNKIEQKKDNNRFDSEIFDLPISVVKDFEFSEVLFDNGKEILFASKKWFAYYNRRDSTSFWKRKLKFYPEKAVIIDNSILAIDGYGEFYRFNFEGDLLEQKDIGYRVQMEEVDNRLFFLYNENEIMRMNPFDFSSDMSRTLEGDAIDFAINEIDSLLYVLKKNNVIEVYELNGLDLVDEQRVLFQRSEDSVTMNSIEYQPLDNSFLLEDSNKEWWSIQSKNGLNSAIQIRDALISRYNVGKIAHNYLYSNLIKFTDEIVNESIRIFEIDSLQLQQAYRMVDELLDYNSNANPTEHQFQNLLVYENKLTGEKKEMDASSEVYIASKIWDNPDWLYDTMIVLETKTWNYNSNDFFVYHDYSIDECSFCELKNTLKVMKQLFSDEGNLALKLFDLEYNSYLEIPIEEYSTLNFPEAKYKISDTVIKSIHEIRNEIEETLLEMTSKTSLNAHLDLLLAKLYLIEERYEDSEVAVLRARKTAPGWISPKIVYGELLLKTKRLNEGLELFEELKQGYPNLPEVYHYLAKIHYKSGDKTQFLRNLSKAINLDPNMKIEDNIKEEYKELLSDENNREKAIFSYSKGSQSIRKIVAVLDTSNSSIALLSKLKKLNERGYTIDIKVWFRDVDSSSVLRFMDRAGIVFSYEFIDGNSNLIFENQRSSLRIYDHEGNLLKLYKNLSSFDYQAAKYLTTTGESNIHIMHKLGERYLGGYVYSTTDQNLHGRVYEVHEGKLQELDSLVKTLNEKNGRGWRLANWKDLQEIKAVNNWVKPKKWLVSCELYPHNHLYSLRKNKYVERKNQKSGKKLYILIRDF